MIAFLFLGVKSIYLMKSLLDDLAEESHQTEDQLRPWDMFSKGHRIKSCILILAWITACISFFALSLNTTDLSGDIFENFFLARSSAFATVLWFMLKANFVGRTKSLVISHGILGISCIILAFIPKENVTAVLAVYMLASIVASVSKYL